MSCTPASRNAPALSAGGRLGDIAARFCGLLLGTFAAAHFAHEARAVDFQAEIQINLCSAPGQVIRALQLSKKGKATTVWLFDSPALALNQRGFRLRLREKGKNAELTLKVAGQNCASVEAGLLQPDGKCEADLHGDSLEDVVSLTRQLDAQNRGKLLAPEAARGAPLAAVLAAELDRNQRSALAAGRGVVSGAALLPEDIARLGPSRVRAYHSANEAHVVEVWTLPGGQQFVELSEKTRRDTALARRTVLIQKLSASGVVICSDQDSQAKIKLAILSR